MYRFLLMTGTVCLAAACHDQTSLQQRYVSQRSLCQTAAELDVTRLLPGGGSEEDKNAQMVGRFSDCMSAQGWTIANPVKKDDKGKEVASNGNGKGDDLEALAKKKQAKAAEEERVRQERLKADALREERARAERAEQAQREEQMKAETQQRQMQQQPRREESGQYQEQDPYRPRQRYEEEPAARHAPRRVNRQPTPSVIYQRPESAGQPMMVPAPVAGTMPVVTAHPMAAPGARMPQGGVTVQPMPVQPMPVQPMPQQVQPMPQPMPPQQVMPDPRFQGQVVPQQVIPQQVQPMPPQQAIPQPMMPQPMPQQVMPDPSMPQEVPAQEMQEMPFPEMKPNGAPVVPYGMPSNSLSQPTMPQQVMPGTAPASPAIQEIQPLPQRYAPTQNQ